MPASNTSPQPPAERPLWFSIMCLLLVLVLALVIGYRAAPASLNALEAVELRVTTAGAAPTLQLIALADRYTGERHALPAGRHWLIEKRPVTALGLLLPADWRRWLETVEVRIGSRVQRYDADALAARWQQGVPRPAPGEPELWWAPAAALAMPGIVARRTTALNAPADADVLWRVFAFPALLLLALIALMSLRRGWAGPLTAGAMETVAPAAAPREALVGRAWLAFGVGIVASALILAERIEPYYFTQGDNLTRLLPIALDGCARLDGGAWPDFDPYQMLGMPMASAGVYGLSYPPLWLACGLARDVLGRETALYEVYAGLHLLFGFLAAWWLGRREGLSPALATAFGLSVALAGIFLIGGRSWAQMLPAALWLPLLLRSARSLESTARPFRWVLASGLAIGLFYHAGNRDLWFFGLLAWALLIACARSAGALGRQRLGWAAAALLLGLAVAMPLLVAETRLHAGSTSEAASGHGIWNALAALLLPYPLVDAGDPEAWAGAGQGSMSPLYYSGTLLTLAGALSLAAALAAWLRGAWDGGFWQRQRWPLLALLALLFCLGDPGFLWSLAGLLPTLQRDAYPWELLALLVLALNLAGAQTLQRLLPGGWHLAVALAVAVLMTLHVGLARQSFGHFTDDPYPSLPPAIAARLAPAAGDGRLGPRLAVLAPARDARPGFTASLPGNLATYHRLPTPDGDDAAIRASPEWRRLLRELPEAPREALSRFGVRWLLAYRPEAASGAPATPTAEASAFAARAAALVGNMAPIVSAGGLALFDLGPPEPLAFFADAPAAALPVSDHGGGVSVALPALAAPRRAVLNFLWRPGLEASADGAPLAHAADAAGRVLVTVPAGARELRLGHSFGWGRGLYYGLVLGLVALALLVLLLRFGPADRAGED